MKKDVTAGVLLVCACLAVAMAVPQIEQVAQKGREDSSETDIIVNVDETNRIIDIVETDVQKNTESAQEQNDTLIIAEEDILT